MKINKLACLGDSITEGFEIPKEKTWPFLLMDLLHCNVLNAGVSGETSSGMLSRFQKIRSSYKPSHLIIMGGTNDLRYKLDLAVILTNILSIARQARKDGIEYIIAVPPSFYPTGEDYELSYLLEEAELENALKDWQDLLREFCKKDECRIIDFSALKRQHFLADGLHPNEEGHLLMATIAANELKSDSSRK